MHKNASCFPQTDLIILPCDFIAPAKLKLSAFLNEYRVDMDRPLLKALLYERGETLKDGTAQRVGYHMRTERSITSSFRARCTAIRD